MRTLQGAHKSATGIPVALLFFTRKTLVETPCFRL
jgi:hypothetical protein